MPPERRHPAKRAGANDRPSGPPRPPQGPYANLPPRPTQPNEGSSQPQANLPPRSTQDQLPDRPWVPPNHSYTSQYGGMPGPQPPQQGSMSGSNPQYAMPGVPPNHSYTSQYGGMPGPYPPQQGSMPG
ncbi:hypothetical protein P280DRAFT_552643, partial [Massarina eburnea CBS 473.64]